MAAENKRIDRRMRGFERAAGLMQRQIRDVGEARGFAESRLLTDWHEIAGAEISAISRPVRITYRKGGFGATLVLLVKGAHAPMVQADLPRITERVNACYGYRAVSHIHLTQTAPTGFAEGQAHFEPAPRAASQQDEPPRPDEATARRARELAADIGNPGLRCALESLAENVLSPRHMRAKRQPK